jgi:hypothetical protein
MAVAQLRQMRQMPHFWNGKCNLLKQIKHYFFQNLSKFTPFASLYSDPVYGRGTDCKNSFNTLAVSKVRHLPHLPQLRYGHKYLSPLAQARSTQYNIMWFSLPGYSGFLHQSNWPPWYNWVLNIVESGVKHHNPNHEGVFPFHGKIFFKFTFLLTVVSLKGRLLRRSFNGAPGTESSNCHEI